jgi:hypothetical protein
MDEMLTNGAAVVKGLEIDKFIITVIEGVILLKALNSLSPRSFSFFNPAFLGFPGRSVEVL